MKVYSEENGFIVDVVISDNKAKEVGLTHSDLAEIISAWTGVTDIFPTATGMFKIRIEDEMKVKGLKKGNKKVDY